VGVMATLLDSLSNKSTRAKPSMQKGALVRGSRALRSAPERLSALITYVTFAGQVISDSLTLVPLIGLAVDVMIRLKNVKDESWTHLSADIKVWLPAFLKFFFYRMLIASIPSRMISWVCTPVRF